jgi:hypothetical protein
MIFPRTPVLFVLVGASLAPTAVGCVAASENVEEPASEEGEEEADSQNGRRPRPRQPQTTPPRTCLNLVNNCGPARTGVPDK